MLQYRNVTSVILAHVVATGNKMSIVSNVNGYHICICMYHYMLSCKIACDVSLSALMHMHFPTVSVTNEFSVATSPCPKASKGASYWNINPHFNYMVPCIATSNPTHSSAQVLLTSFQYRSVQMHPTTVYLIRMKTCLICQPVEHCWDFVTVHTRRCDW